MDEKILQAGERIGKGALESIKTNFLTEDERKQAGDLLVTIGAVRLREIAGEDVSSHLPILEDAYVQWKAVASGEAAEAFKATAGEVVSMGAKFVSTVLRGVFRV